MAKKKNQVILEIHMTTYLKVAQIDIIKNIIKLKLYLEEHG